jgi:hypothetical protein
MKLPLHTQLPQEFIYKESKNVDDWVALMMNLDSIIIDSKLSKKTQDYMLDITCVAANEIINQQTELEIKQWEIMNRLKKETLEYEYIYVVPIYKIENTLNEILLGINPKEVKTP